jgi:hypothetical protein
VVVEASLLGVPSGQDTVEADHAVGQFTAARLTVARMGGFGVNHTNRAGFFVTLAEPTTLITVASNQLMGDTFYVSLADPLERLGALESLSLMASGLAEFTITNESRILLPTDPLNLSIEATGPNRITVGWPYFPCNCFGLQSTTNFTPYSYINRRTTVYEEFEYRTSVDTGLFPQGYFDLHYNYSQ